MAEVQKWLLAAKLNKINYLGDFVRKKIVKLKWLTICSFFQSIDDALLNKTLIFFKIVGN